MYKYKKYVYIRKNNIKYIFLNKLLKYIIHYIEIQKKICIAIIKSLNKYLIVVNDWMCTQDIMSSIPVTRIFSRDVFIM